RSVPGVWVVLLGLEADRTLAVVLGCLIDAGAGAAGRREHDIDAAIELAFGELAAAARIVPRRRRGAGHVGQHFDVGIGGLGALGVAALETADQRDVHAADEADLARL